MVKKDFIECEMGILQFDRQDVIITSVFVGEDDDLSTNSLSKVVPDCN